MISAAKVALVSVQLTGLALSALLVAVTYATPVQVEERLQAFAIAKVERAADAAWSGDTAEGSRADRLAALSRRLGQDAEQIDQNRRLIVQAVLANALSDRCKANCEFHVAAAVVLNAAMIQRAARLRLGQATLEEFVLERYEASVRGLILDLRRFGMVNVVALALMIGLVVFGGRLSWRFAAFSVAVTSYTAWAAYGYVFDQNWALSILLQDWAGPGYQVGMVFASCLFFDWLFLRGMISRTVTNAIASVLPS